MSKDETTQTDTVVDEAAERRRLAAVRQIRTVGDPVLRDRAKPVSAFDGDLKRLSRRMIEIMHDAPGIGLAAPQVGVARRVIVYDVHEDPVTLVNPEITWRSEETDVVEEGCLSVPGVSLPVERPVRIRVRGSDTGGHDLDYEAEEIEARVIQHEVDHLDGVLILERTSREERAAAMRRLRDGGPTAAAL